jgi:glycosyltransferase involved in cell wall biosynthesis
VTDKDTRRNPTLALIGTIQSALTGTIPSVAEGNHSTPAESLTHLVSVVIPVYQGEKTLESVVMELEPLTREQSTPQGKPFRVVEAVLVHDGAIDNSDQVMETLARRYEFVKLIWLSRNFGQHPATLAGMATTVGDWIVTMDEDGQQNPADIGKLLDVALDHCAELVYAGPINEPPHGWFRNRMSRLAKWLFSVGLGGGDIGRFNSFRLVDGEVGRCLAAYCGNSVYLDVALGWVVANRAECAIPVREGHDRPSGYNLWKLLQHFHRLLLTSGTRPLRFITLLGLLSFVLATIFTLYVIYEKVTAQVPIQGWASTLMVICFFSGCILFCLGVIAEYLGVALTMNMGKPLYLVVSRPRRRKGPKK